MSEQLALRYELAEARGQIAEGMAIPLTYATVAEVGVKAAMKGYYGQSVLEAALTETKNDLKSQPGMSNTEAEEMALEIAEANIRDIAPLVGVMKNARPIGATHTTMDFPIALSMLRQRQIRDAYMVKDSAWRSFAAVRTVPNFNPIRTLAFTEMPELKKRAEATDVTYATFTESEQGYRAANYERAVKYTWEMWLADDVGAFGRMLESLGRGARRTETIVVFEAIKAGLVRTPLTTALAAPNVARMAELERVFNSRMFRDSDGNELEYGLELNRVLTTTRHRQAFAKIMGAEFEGGQTGEINVMRDAFSLFLEPLWARVLGTDVVGFDASNDWLEVAFVRGFQGGPLTYTKIPDVREHPDQGSFHNHSMEVKLGHSMGAKVVMPHAAIRAEMSALPGTAGEVVVSS